MRSKYKKSKKGKVLAIVITLAVIVAIVTALVLAVVLTGKEDVKGTDIQTEGFISEKGIYKLTVDSSVKTYDILSKVTLNSEATYELSLTSDFSTKLSSSVVELKHGENLVYLKVAYEDEEDKTYTFNIYRKKLFTVTFDTAGVGAIDSKTVEEGTTISAPSVSKPGHTLKWDYDFSKPITSDLTVKAIWTPFDCVITTNVDGVKTEYKLLYGEIATEIPTPDKLGYKFIGWKYGDVVFDATKAYEYSETEIEIVATFAPIVYNVQYVMGNGATNSADNKSSFTIEDLSLVLSDPTHSSPNYVFIAWRLDTVDGELVDVIDDAFIEALNGAEAIVLHAEWRIDSKVTYNANGGVCDLTGATFSVNSEYSLPTPNRDNYIFDGWYYNGARIESTGVWTVPTDAELVAMWTPRSSDIEYVLNGGTNGANPDVFDFEDEDFILLDPTYDDSHIFDGWYTDISCLPEFKIEKLTKSMVGDNDITLYAKWITVVDVTLNANSGTCDENSIKINFGSSYKLPVPTRDKYIFSGWYYGTTPVSLEGVWSYSVDLELKAEWTPKEYKITYELNGGTNNSENPLVYTVETDINDLLLKNPTKLYCTFLGWFLDKELTIPVTSIDPTSYEGVTVYASWEHIEVTFNFDANGGEVSKDKEVVFLGDSYILPEPTLAGHKFEGWYFGDVLVPTKGAWTDENALTLDLVAKWSLIEYSISYDLAGGECDENALVKKYTYASGDIVLPKPTREHYYFVGWTIDGGYANPNVIITKGSTGNREYKAVWAEKKDSTTGLLFSMVDGKAVVVGIDREITSSITAGIKIPATYNGVDVVAIESGAFKAFGEKFSKTSYANMQSSYVTISIPTSIQKVGANAFENCFGIKVSLYDPDEKNADYKAWDKTVLWEAGNISARDCIWGFRPAIGWTRYSMVPIPDDYE